MNNFNLSQDEKLTLKLSHYLQPLNKSSIEIYFSLPDEMGINPDTLSEDAFFISSIRSQSAYYSEQLHLPLVRSRFISQKKGETTDYRVNLNLFAYQIRIALDRDIKLLLKQEDQALFFPAAREMAGQTQALLKKLRRYSPPDKELSAYFEHVDNYLSWYIEQAYLALLAKGPKPDDYVEQSLDILQLCQQENQYRLDCGYNNVITLADANRITNKMRLLKKLSEYGVVFKRETHNLDGNVKRLVRGGVTAIIMAFVMLLVLNARSSFTEITLALIVLLGFIYGVRETFKDDLTQYIWRKIQQGRAKWRNIFTNTATGSKLTVQTLWLEYIAPKKLPPYVANLFNKRRQQNRQDAQLLYFKAETKVLVKKFLPGYEELQEQIFFNLSPLVHFLKQGNGILYQFDGENIEQLNVERRYQINVVIAYQKKSHKKLAYAQRFKVTVNRSEIVAIEKMEKEKFTLGI